MERKKEAVTETQQSRTGWLAGKVRDLRNYLIILFLFGAELVWFHTLNKGAAPCGCGVQFWNHHSDSDKSTFCFSNKCIFDVLVLVLAESHKRAAVEILAVVRICAPFPESQLEREQGCAFSPVPVSQAVCPEPATSGLSTGLCKV